MTEWNFSVFILFNGMKMSMALTFTSFTTYSHTTFKSFLFSTDKSVV